ncbi:1793_t:CDS:2, partial [Acaulospora morrowiae]
MTDKRRISSEKRINGESTLIVENANTQGDGDLEKTHVEGELFEGENSSIPMVAAAVSTKDDPKLPCLTFRFW